MTAPPALENANGIHMTHNVMVRMRDGVHLATDIYRPAIDGVPVADGLPVLLERTPYDKLGTNQADRSRDNAQPLSKPEIAEAFVRAGYIVAIQDCRGRYRSEGLFEKYLSEGIDGFDTIAWLKAQSWCDGRIGTYGLSYSAHTQSALASLDPPGLAAMFLDSGGFSSAFHSGIRQGGAFELKQATWAYKHALLSPETERDPARRQALEAEDLRAWFAQMPWSKGNSPLRAAPEYEDYLLEQWQSGEFGPYWKRHGLYAAGCYAEFSDVPMVFLTGWFDPYARTAAENFTGLAHIKRGPVKLVLGPWTHGQRSVTYAGDVDFGPAATLDGNIAPDYIALRRAWFDRHIRNEAAPDYLPAPVKLFVMGGGSGARNAQGRLEHGGAWRDEQDWPPPRATLRDLFLQQWGEMTLSPPGSEGVRGFLSDPDHPVPTIGGAIASGAPVMEAGAYDQRTAPEIFGAVAPYGPLGARDDVLVFQTAPLPEAMEATGPVRAHLFVSSSTPDADITIKLIDVYPPSPDWPEGFAMNLTHGILRLRYRDSFARPEMMEPGRVYQINVEAFPTANLFAKGHRIRLDIAGSNFPHFDVNPNSGEAQGSAAKKQIAHIKIYLGPEHPSRLSLSIVPSLDG